MEADPIETDYFVVGAGAVAMSFVDTLLSESDAKIAMVDRRHRPGGHWNDAYSFVGLHQPAAFYGVNSRELCAWSKDETGLNAGMYSLASGAEVLSYFDQVMRQRFLASGRVTWFPMSEYSIDSGGAHRITSLVNGAARRVIARKALVNATHARTTVPSTHPPKYAIASGVTCVPLNRLPEIRRPRACFTVVGSGKTGMDACLWLLQNGAAPESIRWIMPRDAWLMDRAHSQPGAENFMQTIGSGVAQFEAVAAAHSIADLFSRLEERGILLRIDKNVAPTTYRCAVVSQAELTELRRIENIVRLGRVKALEPTRIVLEQGSLAADPDTLYVDCSASAIQTPPSIPVFEAGCINLLMVRLCQPLFSAALIAYVEGNVAEMNEKNALCVPVPSPEYPIDWLRMWAATIANAARWRQHAGLNAWLSQCRLNSLAAAMRGVKPDDFAKFALLRENGVKAAAALAKIPELLATAE
jgi:hypothetical protein